MCPRILASLVLGIVAVSGCASSGRIKYEGKIFELNCSTFQKEEDGQYRIWAWRHEAGLLDIFGNSPAGIQMVLPATTEAGTIYDLETDCSLWIRGDWNFVSDLAETLWEETTSGTVHIQIWNPDRKIVEGTFEAQTPKGPVSGIFQVRPDTQDK
jgi:hypothetical protein